MHMLENEIDVDIGMDNDSYVGPSARVVSEGDAILIRPPFYELDTSVCLIGRLADCQIVVEHKFVSKLHAKIEFRDDHYFLTDLESKNGTFVNGERIWEPSVLQDGDVIGLGADDPLLRFERPDGSQVA